LRAGAALALVLGLWSAAFFRVQVLQADHYRLWAERNRLRELVIPAPRGLLLDRHGHLAATTEPVHVLELRPAPAAVQRARLDTLAPVLGLTPAAMDSAVAQAQPRERLRLARPLRFEQVAWLEEHRFRYPWVLLTSRPERRYPAGPAAAHVVGYLGEISEAQLSDPRWAGYRRGQLVGQMGLERAYDRWLGGRAGARYVEVDATGRVVRELDDRAAIPPEPGRDLPLTLDLELQRYVHAIWPRGKAGALVALDPATGGVLALYSAPTFDPNALLGPERGRAWRALVRDPARPLLNRAIQGHYPPASTFKLVTAAIALEHGVLDPGARMPIPCTGGLTYAGRYARCWRPEGHGYLDLAGAIAHSCNVYFYQVGIRLGLAELLRAGARLGFAGRTGIDLPGERRGTFPDGLGWYRRTFGHGPTPSEVLSVAIGQGPNAQTPLRLAQFYAALATDGRARRPHLARRAEPAPVETDLQLRPTTLAALRTGMERVTEPGGTAYLASLRRWKLAGKTGTAQNSQDPRRPHAWFVGYAGPPNGPAEIVLAVILEFGEHGSDAAPIAAKAADFYLSRRHGLPPDPLPTLGERLSGRPWEGSER